METKPPTHVVVERGSTKDTFPIEPDTGRPYLRVELGLLFVCTAADDEPVAIYAVGAWSRAYEQTQS